MLIAYFGRLAPMIEAIGGEVHEFVGDEILAIFNKHGDQPDHALRAARAALALQRAADEIAPTIRSGRASASASTAATVVAAVVGGATRPPQPRRLRRHRQPRRAARGQRARRVVIGEATTSASRPARSSSACHRSS